MVLSITPLIFSKVMTLMQYFSSGIIQLVALPLLAYVSDKGTRDMMQLMTEMHGMLSEEIRRLHDKHDELRESLFAANPDLENINVGDTESGNLF